MPTDQQLQNLLTQEPSDATTASVAIGTRTAVFVREISMAMGMVSAALLVLMRLFSSGSADAEAVLRAGRQFPQAGDDAVRGRLAERRSYFHPLRPDRHSALGAGDR